MSYGPISVFTVTMASAGTLSSEISLGRAWKLAYLDPTGANSEVRIQGTTEAGGTYRQIYHPSINSSTVGANIFKIPSSVSGGLIPIPTGLKFLKVETTAAVTNGQAFKIICSD